MKTDSKWFMLATKPVTADEMNKAMDSIRGLYKEYGFPFFKWVNSYHDVEFNQNFAYIYETRNYIHLVAQFPDGIGSKAYYKWSDLALAIDGVIDQQKYEIFALSAIRTFNRCVNHLIPKMHEVGEAEFSSTARLYFNPMRNKQETRAYEYDMNSAYGYGMKYAPLPDTRCPLGKGVLEKGQIGFNPSMCQCVTTSVGDFCEYRFPIMSDEDRKPLSDWVDRWYNKKKNAKNEFEKHQAKAFIVIPVGNFQRTNWFMRSAIVEYCNGIIMDLEERYPSIIKSNTDAVITTERIPELEANMGPDLGQWKLEKEGIVLYKDHSEQWFDKDHNTIDFKIRGLRKSKIGDGFNLITNYNIVDSTRYRLCTDMGDLQTVYIEDLKP